MVLVVNKAILAATIMCISVHQSADFALQCVFFALMCPFHTVYGNVCAVASQRPLPHFMHSFTGGAMMVCMFFDIVWLIMLAMSALCVKIAAEDSVSAVTCAVNILSLSFAQLTGLLEWLQVHCTW